MMLQHHSVSRFADPGLAGVLGDGKTVAPRDDRRSAVVRSVAIYVPSLDGGGAERVAALLASGFAEAGLATTLLVDREAAANERFVGPGVDVVMLGAGHLGGVARLARWLRRAAPDAVLAIDAPASLKLVAAQAIARSPCATVISFHGFSRVMSGALARLAFPLAPLLSRLADRTVCVSASLARHLVADWRAASGRVAVIPNPVLLGRGDPARSADELAARPPTVLAMGRLVPQKGFETLIAAVGRLSPDVRLEILGDGPHRAALEAAAARAGLAGRVSMPGYLAEPWVAYRRARVFAMTSESESFSNVIVEAFAAGLPVVATDCGGPREILDGGRHGALVPVGDVAAIADALRAALDRPGDPGPRLRRAADFAVEAAVAAYLALFRDIMAGRGRARR